jgi:hypothetical protein
MSQSEQEMARANILQTAMRALAQRRARRGHHARQNGQSTGALAARIEMALAQIREETALGDERQELVDYFRPLSPFCATKHPLPFPPAYCRF